MKRLILFLFLLPALPAKPQTSVYHPFPDSNAVWDVNTYIWAGCFPVADLNEDYSYVITGDTMINSTVYHKLNIPFIQSNCSGLHTSGYKGCIRQDTTTKKVYYMPPGNSTDTLLYDFSMQLGDTIKGMLAPPSVTGTPDTVISIDSILIGTEYRKRWFTNTCYQIYFIEGVGSTYGLLENSPGCIVDAAVISITCFSQNGNTLYPDTTTSCEIILGVKNIPENNFSVFISPNPFHTLSSFSITGNRTIRNAELKIYNVFGKRTSTQTIRNESTIIDRAGLANGIYFYQLTTENESEILARGKFLIE